MHPGGPFEQCPSQQSPKRPVSLFKAPEWVHDGPMGEKPLSIDDAPAQASTVGGTGPPGGDTPPPDVSGAAGINTTRSNIKNSGAVAGGGTGPELTDTDGRPDRPGIAIKEQGVG